MASAWLDAVAMLSLAGAGLCALLLAFDLMRRPQSMWIMNVVWPVTALYLGPLAVWLYRRYGRAPARGAPMPAMHAGHAMAGGKPFWAVTAIGATHCGAGCTLGDIIAEYTLFLTGFTIVGSRLLSSMVADFTLAYLFGIAFQYFALAPMRGISGWTAIWAAVKADTLSLVAFEVGLFAWMWLMSVAFRPPLEPNVPTYWFSMQIGMALGFATSYPMNWWLLRRGVKEPM